MFMSMSEVYELIDRIYDRVINRTKIEDLYAL